MTDDTSSTKGKRERLFFWKPKNKRDRKYWFYYHGLLLMSIAVAGWLVADISPYAYAHLLGVNEDKPVTVPQYEKVNTKTGDPYWEVVAPPIEIQTEQKVAFSDEFYSAGEWLESLGVEDVNVVYTINGIYNCGTRTGSRMGGCYSTAYANTIFVYWDEKASEPLKKLLVLHEYSHLVQYWDYYDITYTAYTEGLDFNPAWGEVLEQDATCRIYHEWGNDWLEKHEVRISKISRCSIEDWTSDYLQTQYQSF